MTSLMTPAHLGPSSPARFLEAHVVRNILVCREHFRLTLMLPPPFAAGPGQFVHIAPMVGSSQPFGNANSTGESAVDISVDGNAPLLRRAFSIAGLRAQLRGIEIDLIYRVVGKATRWMSGLRTSDLVSVLGPLGNQFPIFPQDDLSLLIAGGVGLPPLLFLAESLSRLQQRKVVVFCGATTRDLLALTLVDHVPVRGDGGEALACREFAELGIPVVLATDDGSLGFHGRVTAALSAYLEINRIAGPIVSAYTCGPQPMMHTVAKIAALSGIRSFACIERNMACGLGTCQSCVVAVQDPRDGEGWSYRLCCTDGPVFDAAELCW